jgi:hypothetical protein
MPQMIGKYSESETMRRKSLFTGGCIAIAAALALALAPVGAMAQTMQKAPAAAAPMTKGRQHAKPGNEYASEGEAKLHCAGDMVVWANLRSKVYHFSGNRNYGKTKRGAYMCRKEADSGGFHAAKGEKP